MQWVGRKFGEGEVLYWQVGYSVKGWYIPEHISCTQAPGLRRKEEAAKELVMIKVALEYPSCPRRT